MREVIARVLAPSTSHSAKTAATELTARLELSEASRLTADALEREGGLSRTQARRLAAAFALGRRVEQARIPSRPRLRSPERIFRLMAPELRGAMRETFHALLVDSKHRLKRRIRVSEGTLTSSLVHPREVFGPAVRDSACAIVVCHNHPSGDPEPSAEDLEVTRRLLEAGRLLGIPLLDHVVIGDGCFVSLRERMHF